jgi:transposase
VITKKQERILRLCHHDFGGLTQAEAAQRLGVSQSVISNALKYVEKVIPDFFPILTKLEAQIYHHYMTEGWSVDEIAEHFGLTPNSIYKTLQRVKNKGMYFTKAKGRALQYDPSMDANIKEIF